MDPALWQLSEAGEEDDEVSVVLRLVDEARAPETIRIVARFGTVVTARLRRGDIRRTWENELVASMKASRSVALPLVFEEEDEPQHAPETSPASARPSPRRIPEDGSGVIVAACDWGLDFTHPNFRNADGTTRLLALWDQRGSGGNPPQPYGYGHVHTREAIDAALTQADPFGALGYDLHASDQGNRGTHGTHVCDILAGSGRVPGSTVGFAPGAAIVFVELTSAGMGELDDFGDSVALLEALDYVRKLAGGKPCVINLSAGKTGGEHRGTNPFERAVDTMLARQDNLALVQSVGNYANTAMHTHARIGPDRRHVLEWRIHPRDRTPNELEIWYSGQDELDVTLVSPPGDRFTVPLGEKLRLEHGLEHWGNFYHRRLEPNSQLNHVDIFLRPGSPPGTWKVELYGREVLDGRLHAWIERDAGGQHQSRFSRRQATSSYTTNTICNSYRGLAVGAYDATAPDRPATRFSSRGPTADGRQKPELVAPGYRIRAARSVPRGGWSPGDSQLTVKSGSSMASPCVAGTVALMYQAAGRPLSINEVRRALIGSVDPHPGPDGRSSARLGYGYLDTEAAVAAVRGMTARAAPSEALVDEDWRDEDFGDDYTDDEHDVEGFEDEVDELGLDPEAAFRSRHAQATKGSPW